MKRVEISALSPGLSVIGMYMWLPKKTRIVRPSKELLDNVESALLSKYPSLEKVLDIRMDEIPNYTG